MRTNNQFVLLDMKDKSYSVYVGRVEVARFEQQDPKTLVYLSADEVEELRREEYKDKA